MVSKSYHHQSLGDSEPLLKHCLVSSQIHKQLLESCNFLVNLRLLFGFSGLGVPGYIGARILNLSHFSFGLAQLRFDQLVLDICLMVPPGNFGPLKYAWLRNSVPAAGQ